MAKSVGPPNKKKPTAGNTKAAKKNTKAAVAATLKKRTIAPKNEQIIKIIIEVVVKDGAIGRKVFNEGLYDEIDRTIKYSFTGRGITVISLEVEDKRVQRPGKTGTIELDFLPPTVWVSAFATGQGTGSLQLTYSGKDLFTTPVDFIFTAGKGFIEANPKLR